MCRFIPARNASTRNAVILNSESTSCRFLLVRADSKYAVCPTIQFYSKNYRHSVSLRLGNKLNRGKLEKARETRRLR